MISKCIRMRNNRSKANVGKRIFVILLTCFAMEKFSLKKRLYSFKYAFEGVKTLIKFEHNVWIHLLATVVVVGSGFLFSLSKTEWLMVIVAIGFVWISEGFNTGIEYLCNAISTKENPEIKKAKDVAAGTVLLSAIVAIIIGVIVFLPHLLNLF